MKWLNNLKLMFKWKDLTDSEHAWWVSIGCPTFVIYGGQERRVKDTPRPGTVPWDETYERRTKPHTYEETSNG